ncbi:MAG: hypothetical protein OEY49_09190 [Candidatus Heimdallarchaeota archaeon]|nr:hypothetical protein [Candidatus Heimdallarchaeota archaeon]
MSEYIKSTWKNDKLLRIIIFWFVILFTISIILQNIIGAPPTELGETILGDRNTTLELEANSTVQYSVAYSSDYNYFAFNSNVETRLILIKKWFDTEVNISTVEEIDVLVNETTKKFATYLKEKTNITAIIISPEDVPIKYVFEFIEFDSNDRQLINNWSLGYIIKILAVVPLIVKILILILRKILHKNNNNVN